MSATLTAGAEHDIRLDHDIAPEPRIGREEHGLRRDQGCAPIHRAPPQPLLHQRFGGGQLGAGVDAQEVLGRQFSDAARKALRAGDRDDVGQIEFALGVVVPDSVHKIEGMARIDRHDAAVAEPDRPFLGAGVPGLDDAHELAVAAEHEAAIGSGVGWPHAGDRDRHLRRAAPRGEQLGDGFAAQQRGVAIEHEDIGDAVLRGPLGEAWRKRRACRTHGIARTAGRGLDHGRQRRDRAGDAVAIAAEHDDRFGRIERPQRVDDVPDHRRSGDLVQHLGTGRFEAGALAGGEDDGGKARLIH